jgi:hypothetical protein
LADITTGAITVLGVTGPHYSRAEELIVSTGNQRGLRTLDAIQLAVALDANGRGGLDFFVVADATLADIAREAGLPITNPETAA